MNGRDLGESQPPLVLVNLILGIQTKLGQFWSKCPTCSDSYPPQSQQLPKIHRNLWSNLKIQQWKKSIWKKKKSKTHHFVGCIRPIDSRGCEFHCGNLRGCEFHCGNLRGCEFHCTCQVLWSMILVWCILDVETMSHIVDGSEIRRENHLKWCWNPINYGRNYQPQLVFPIIYRVSYIPGGFLAGLDRHQRATSFGLAVLITWAHIKALQRCASRSSAVLHLEENSNHSILNLIPQCHRAPIWSRYKYV